MLRHGLVKSGVENGNVGNVWKQGLSCLDPGNVVTVVLRGELHHFTYHFHDRVVYQYRVGEFFTAMGDPVEELGAVSMGAVIDRRAHERIAGYLELARTSPDAKARVGTNTKDEEETGFHARVGPEKLRTNVVETGAHPT